MSDSDIQTAFEDSENTDLAKVHRQPPTSLRGSLTSAVRQAWHPIPVPKPEIDRELPRLPGIQRSAEVLRFKVLQLEYSVSPDGALRGWLKLNVLLSLIIGIPAIFLVPILTYLFSSFVSWTSFLLQSALNILYTLLVVVAIGAVVMGVGIALTRMRSK